mmetsp:Transcript_35491/g.33668  ORF Transcript_35491/g.33668 Transcript_35491/m.33668 type:complete len:230 (+) Transcript_35491:275-964(+)
MKGHGNKAYHNNGRKMLSRINSSSISIFHSIAPGKKVNGCYVCCNAPSCCAICSIVPCCDDSHFLVAQRESSKYFHIRENSIEWNEPEIIMREGNCCGLDPCIFEVQDRVKVIYFDDSMFGKLRNVTRHCNEFRTCLFGGRGERIQISNPCCCGLGYRATCCPCVPICCPQALFPCALREDIYVDDAEQGIYSLKEAMKAAHLSELYGDNSQTSVSPEETKDMEQMDRI